MTPLTPRECEILSLIIKEFSSCEIAAQLELSIRTVETHRKNIYQKTGTRNLVGLIKFSIQAGMMDGFYFVQPADQGEGHVVVRKLQYAG